jgi:hypothetical protein
MAYSEILLALQHQDRTLRHDEISLTGMDHLGGTTQEENGQVTLFCLQWNIPDRVALLLPGLIIHGHRNRIARTCFNDISLLYFLFFLDTGGQVQSTGCPFMGLGRPDQYPVSDHDEVPELVVVRQMHKLVFFNVEI